MLFLQKSTYFLIMIKYNKDKYLNELKDLNKIIKTKELSHRWQRDIINDAYNSGELIKLKNGLYCFKEYISNLSYDINDIVPDGILCMHSAWYYYKLIDEKPEYVNISVPNGMKVILPNCLKYKIFYRTKKQYNFGVNEENVNNCKFKIYDIEHSVCDAFKYRNLIGMDTLISIMKKYMQREDANVEKLIEYSKYMNVSKKLIEIIMFLK